MQASLPNNFAAGPQVGRLAAQPDVKVLKFS